MKPHIVFSHGAWYCTGVWFRHGKRAPCGPYTRKYSPSEALRAWIRMERASDGKRRYPSIRAQQDREATHG